MSQSSESGRQGGVARRQGGREGGKEGGKGGGKEGGREGPNPNFTLTSP